MKKITLILLFLTFPSISEAGWWGYAPWNWTSTSGQESYFRGLGSYWHQYGNYLRSLGQYQIEHQQAQKLKTDNFKQHVLTRWEIRDAYQERVKRQNPPYTDVRNKALDNREKMHALKEREHDLRQKGVLPPLKPQRFIIDGVDYGTYHNFKMSPAFAKMKQTQADIYNREAAQLKNRINNAVNAAIVRNNPPLPPLLVPEVPFGNAIPPRNTVIRKF